MKILNRNNTNSKTLRKVTAGLIFISVLFYSPSYIYSAQDKITVFFYSSESNINNFKSLKMEFDKYLSGYGTFEFQPFSDRIIFEEQIKGKNQSILILSSWHYCIIHKKFDLVPVLVGVQNGKNCQRRILVVNEKTDDIKTALQSLASSSSHHHTQSVIKKMFRSSIYNASAIILEVPKDIDALMSVGFGISRSALTTENSYAKLNIINPVLFKKMKILARSDESYLLILAVPRIFKEQSQEIVGVIEKMPKFSDGNKRTKMLGIDSWQRIGPNDLYKIDKNNRMNVSIYRER